MKTSWISLFVVAALLPAIPGSPSVRALVGGDSQWSRMRATRSSATPPAITDGTPSFYKRKAEWKKVIDEYWGPGLPLAQKLQVFNTFADFVQSKYVAFNGLGIRWDSLRSHYRNQITDSTSHGRFSGIMTALAYHLGEAHTVIFDSKYFKVDPTINMPIYPAWGTPVLAMLGASGNHLGATVSPLPDSSLLVIRTTANHPLGLAVGDVVLGYEGIPWKYLWKELLATEMPLFLPSGGSRSSVEHLWLTAGGVNWHLFDTIDVVKYPSGDTVHLPVDTLKTLKVPGVLCYKQSLDVPGVPEPDYMQIYSLNTRPVTYGKVQGTNIGYVHVTSHVNPATRDEFIRAVDAFRNTDGMIIDIRHDFGGETLYHLGQGLARMMNFKTYTFDIYRRASPSDFFALVKFPPPPGSAGGNDWYIDADPETLYDRPVAVLVGPHCVSMGDVSAYMLKLLPNARFFGKPIRACMAAHWEKELLPDLYGFDMEVSDAIVQDYHTPPRLLERAEFPVDEEVWLTQADVVKGEDTVVKRALAWIKGVAYAHDVAVSSRFCHPGMDTLRLTAQVENPNSHPISVKAYIKRDTTVVDSMAFADDGLHGDGKTDDGLWGLTWRLPANEEMYSATVVTTDPVDKSVYSMPFSARFTTAGPIVFQHLSARKHSGDLVVFENPAVCNHGLTVVVPSVTGTLRKLEGDTVIDRVYNARITYGDIPPDSVIGTSRFYSLTLRSPADSIRLGVDLASDGFTYWTDTLTFYFPDAVADKHLSVIPIDFALHQNYPNPFNPSTTINYGLPNASEVRLAVYDLLGREVSVLVNGRKDAGVHEVRFDGSGLSSGVYLYRLTAGSFVQTRKMIVVR